MLFCRSLPLILHPKHVESLTPGTSAKRATSVASLSADLRHCSELHNVLLNVSVVFCTSAVPLQSCNGLDAFCTLDVSAISTDQRIPEVPSAGAAPATVLEALA